MIDEDINNKLGRVREHSKMDKIKEIAKEEIYEVMIQYRDMPRYCS